MIGNIYIWKWELLSLNLCCVFIFRKKNLSLLPVMIFSLYLRNIFLCFWGYFWFINHYWWVKTADRIYLWIPSTNKNIKLLMSEGVLAVVMPQTKTLRLFFLLILCFRGVYVIAIEVNNVHQKLHYFTEIGIKSQDTFTSSCRNTIL